MKKVSNGFRKLNASEIATVAGGGDDPIVVEGKRENEGVTPEPIIVNGVTGGGGSFLPSFFFRSSPGVTGSGPQVFDNPGFSDGGAEPNPDDEDGEIVVEGEKDDVAICIGAGADGLVGQVCGASNGDSGVRVGFGTPGAQVDGETSESISGLDVNSTNIVFGITVGDVNSGIDELSDFISDSINSAQEAFNDLFVDGFGVPTTTLQIP